MWAAGVSQTEDFGQDAPSKDEQLYDNFIEMSGRGLEVESTFDAITYWNHDADPSPFDHLPRWLEWCQLAPQLHAPLTLTDFLLLVFPTANRKLVAALVLPTFPPHSSLSFSLPLWVRVVVCVCV